MMPGMGGRLDARRMNQMMKSLGIHVEELEDVEEVLIRTRREELRFTAPSVTLMDAKGQKTYQVVGNPSVSPLSGAAPPANTPAPAAVKPAPPAKPVIPDEDVAMVAEQTGKPRPEAKKALEAAGGDIAEAILRLTEG